MARKENLVNMEMNFLVSMALQSLVMTLTKDYRTHSQTNRYDSFSDIHYGVSEQNVKRR